MTGLRALSILGAAARWTRRARFGHLLAVFVDAIDGVLLRTDTAPLAATYDGVKLRGYLRHRSFLAYFASGMAKESYYRSLVLDIVKEGTTFVDAGAHIGLYTLLTCRRARRVLAFEPDPYNVAALRRNVATRGCANVEIHPQGLADRAGHRPFRAFRSTFSGSLFARDVEDYRELEIELVSLDDALDDADLEDLVVKLDVEGAEPLALSGMRETILSARSLALFVEVNPPALEAGGFSAQQLVADLLATGMDCAVVDERRRALVWLSEAKPLKKGNLLCRKDNRHR